MKKIYTAILLVCISSILHAQQITGKINDAAEATPLAGASITSGGKTRTTSQKDGTFSLDCKYAGLIIISYVGYETRKIEAACGSNINITLIPIGGTLENVEITATSSQNKSLLYQPMSISKLNNNELKRGNGLFLDDAINGNVPGVTMNRRGVSSGQQFNIRGYGNGTRGTRGISSNFDGQGYKVYLNGIPVTDAEGITMLDDIDFNSVGNVEILKGPSGTLFGQAIAGVVNLKTVSPEKGTYLGQDIMFGNYGLQRFTTHFETANERSSLLLNYGHQRSEGFTIHNNSTKQFVNVASHFNAGSKQSVMAYFGYSNSYDERSGELTTDQWDNNDFSGNINYIRNNAHSEVLSVRGGLGHTYTFNNHLTNTTTVFVTSVSNNASSAGGWTDKSSTNFGVRSTFDTKFNIGNNTILSGITGIESQRQNAQSLSYAMTKNPDDTAPVWQYGNPYYYVIGDNRSNAVTATSSTSVFTEWTLAFPQHFSITGGIGLNTMKLQLDDRIFEVNKPTHFEKTYNDMLSPHLAFNKVFNKKISVYASYSKGYRAPVSSYFYIPWSSSNSASGVVNRQLKPEIANQFEAGSKGVLLKNRLTYQLALFSTIFADKMTTVAVPTPNNGATLYTYVVNGGKQDDKGMELLMRYTAYQSNTSFFETLAPYFNLTYSDFKYKNFSFESGTSPGNYTKVDYSGHPVAGVPKFLINIGADVTTHPGIYANIHYMYKDAVPITSDGLVNGNPYHASSYNLLNGKIGYRHSLSGRFDLDAFFGINNITETKYAIMIFINQLPDAYIAGPTKANYFAGLNLRYKIK